MTPIIAINKIDLLKTSPKEQKRFDEFIEQYSALGYKIFPISCKKKLGLDALLNQMKNKKSVFSGHSGTGKSSIINTLLHTKLKTGKVTKKTLKGSHVTTRSNLIEIDKNSFCIDTPGIKNFSIWDLSLDDIKNYFFEFEKFAKKCQYPGCLHISEPNCAVIKAYSQNKISSLRFEAYRSLMEEILEKKRMQYE